MYQACKILMHIIVQNILITLSSVRLIGRKLKLTVLYRSKVLEDNIKLGTKSIHFSKY